MSKKLTKDSIQDTIVKEANHKLIILEHATGLGKSFSALKLFNKFNSLNVLILVAETAHKGNWLKEFDKFYELYNINLLNSSNITIECYASLHKLLHTEWDIVIMDESHHLSEARLNNLSTIKSPHFIALSATMDKEDMSNLMNTLGITNISEVYHSKVDLKTAIENDILFAPDIHIFPLELDRIFPSEEIIMNRGNIKKRKIIYCDYDKRWEFLKDKINFPDLELRMKVTPKIKYEDITSRMEYWKDLYFRSGQQFAKTKWLGAGSERKRFLSDMKTKEVIKLLPKIDNMRYICFCGSIEQANLLGKENALHSQSDKDNIILENFQSKKISNIFTVGMLVEGQNLKDIEAGIIVQLDNVVRPFVQKSGRVLRSKEPEQFIFYFKGTQDEVYYNKIIENLDHSNVKIYKNVDEYK